jgi:hypothetical protein
MDLLQRIPQIFFDVMARIVPGVCLLVLVQAVTERPIIRWMLEAVAPHPELQKSVVVLVLVLTTSAYVAGHLIGPIVQFMETPPDNGKDKTVTAKASTDAGEQTKPASKPHKTERPPWVKRKAQMIHRAVFVFLPFSREKLLDNEWKQYDWLRLEVPDVGGLVARIRAEYKMYGGLAVVLLVMGASGVMGTIRDWSAQPRWTIDDVFIWSARGHLMFVAAAVIGVPVMVKRHFYTYGTFGKSVRNFYEAAEGRERWKETFLTPCQKKRRTRPA